MIYKEATQNSPSPLPDLRSPNEVAATGILTEYAIRKGIRDGSIPHVKIGNRYKVNFTKLLAMIENC